MIEKVILDYLKQELEVPVYMEVPEVLPDEFVLIEKTGSRTENHIRSATLTIQSWAKTMYRAASLNEQVIEAMDDAVSLSSISRSKLNSDYNYTDTDTKSYRYQAVYDIVHFL